MVYFQTKYPNLGKHNFEGLGMDYVGKFYGHSVYFAGSGMMYQEKYDNLLLSTCGICIAGSGKRISFFEFEFSFIVHRLS
jgi:hypothetical protein